MLAGQPRAQSVALTQLARAYQALGQYRRPGRVSSALELAQKAEDRVQIATVLGNLGPTLSVALSMPPSKRCRKACVWHARSAILHSWPPC